MEKDKLIHRFLDGELSTEQESELFYNLSSDDDMRMELKEQLAIKNAIKGDIKAVTPKAASTMAIFSELGFTPPPVANVPTGGAGGGSSSMGKLWSSLSKYSGFVWTGLTTAATTAVVMLMLLEPGIFFGENEHINSVAEIQNNIDNSSNSVSTSSNSSVPVIESRENDNQETINTNNKNTEEKVVYKYIYITKNEPKKDDVEKVENIVKEIHKSDLDNNYENSLVSNVVPLSNSQMDMGLAAANNDIDKPNSPDFSLGSFGIIVEFKTIKDWTNSGNINPSQYQDWNNTSLGIFKELSSEFAIGLEYRRENFYLDFQGIEGENQMYKYEVYPNISSFTGALRYSPDYLKWYDFSPFVQLAVGANSVGPVGRFFIGTQYSPTESYSLIFGVDGSAMRYNFQNTDYTSKKYGIQLGASFKF